MKRLGLTLILVMALVAAGCGSDDDDGDDAAGENTASRRSENPRE